MEPIKYKVTEVTLAYRHKRKACTYPIITSSEDAAIQILEGFDQKTIGLQEQMVVMYLSQCNEMLALYRSSSGGITGTVVDIRLILCVALKVAAVAMIIAHNHPSGNLKPSNADMELTLKLRDAANLMDIKLLDHLIIAPEKQYYSFADEGLI
jgi:DNA repair protein RadC